MSDRRVGPIVPLAIIAGLLFAGGVLWLTVGSEGGAAPEPSAQHLEAHSEVAREVAAPVAVARPEGTAAAQPRPVEAPARTPPTEVGAIHLRLPVNIEKTRSQSAASQLRDRAAAFFKAKQFRKALPLYELAERMDPDSPGGAERLGATYARAGDSIRAVYFYNRFLELAPNDKLALDLREDVDSYLKENPDPVLQLMRDGSLRPLTQEEADLQSELARRLIDTSNAEADLDWFTEALAALRDAGS